MHRTIFRHREVAHLTSSVHTQDSSFTPFLRKYTCIGAADVFICIFWELVVIEAGFSQSCS